MHSFMYLFRHLLMNIDAFLAIGHFFQFSHKSITGLVH